MPSFFLYGPRRGIDLDVASDFGHVRVRRGRKIFLDLNPYGRLYSAHGTPFETKAQAEMVLHAIRSLIAGGVPKQVAADRGLPRASRAHRCERWLEVWLTRMRELVDAGERAQSYLDELERWCAVDGHIAAWWGDRSVHEITFGELEEWSQWLSTERRLGAKTRKNVMAALHSFLSWLEQQDEIERLPRFPWPTVREHSPVLLSGEAQTRVLHAIPAPKRGIFLALALLGLRPSEAMRARAAAHPSSNPAVRDRLRQGLGESRRRRL